ncbi:hypothetical protein C7H19_24640 [Aphanothece hegewaldii CCALA 016]|uniref:CARDB domain-containing protein n=1 Tax=Aphanothece hegewaldii CCALA 016 TaxID=2107694 RepID=A0A2T1LQK0_9CHRO|nr:CARDB domain-containing protein [Aphanothece hegewaldii]PSF28537.1 hypothetical protein C7H19_24640 [Aphanothece hegewaldii CCALA 016]
MFDDSLYLPDLIVQNAAIDGSQLNFTIKNIGGDCCYFSRVRLFGSSNDTLDNFDVGLGGYSITPLKSGEEISGSLSINSQWRSLAKFNDFILVADGRNKILKKDELNNVLSVGISNKPDLLLSGLSVGTGNNVTKGYGFVPTYTLRNQGNAVAGTSLTKYVVSKDAILGNADDINPTLLTSSTVDAGLLAGATRVENNDYLVIYDDLTPGTYNLFAITDSTNTVAEGNETNNVTSLAFNFALPPQPDFTVEKFAIQSSAAVGSYLNVSYTIRNIDVANVSYSHMTFYLSTDNVIDSSDIALGYHMVSSATPYNVPILRERSLYLDPTKVNAGTYNLIAMVDPYNGTPESNEANNTRSVTVTINPLLRPDLKIANANNVSNQTLNTGSLITVPYTISNTGGVVQRSQTNFYLSTDAVWSTNDILIGTHQVRSLTLNQTRNESASLYINPSGLPVGNTPYYLIFKADAGLVACFESDEANNSFSVPVTIANSGTTSFTSAKGYGVVNAAAAVSSALGASTFADVSNT